MPPSVYKRPLLWALVIFIIGLALFYRPVPAADDVFNFISKEPVTITAVVENFAVSKPKTDNVILKVLAVNGQKAQGRVYGRFAHFEPRWKDTLSVTGPLKVPYGEGLIGNFNWRNYLQTKNVFTEIKPQDVHVVRQAGMFYRAIRFVRKDILNVFSQYFDADLTNIASGILLGERGDLDPDLFTKFQDSGAIHLLVASGGNVGFVMLMCMAVCMCLRVGFKSRWVFSLAVTGLYTLIAGADAPLLRAYFMVICAALGMFWGRNSGLLQWLLISCLVILIIWPASLFETGFQMSFLATLAIIIATANFRLPEKLPRWVYFLYQIFLATLASQVALLPIFTNVFYKVSLTGLLANMVLVPLASCLLVMSFCFYVLAKLHLAGLLFFPLMSCLELFKRLVEFFAGFSFSAIPVSAWKWGTIVCFYAGLFWVLNLPYKNFAKKSAVYIAGLCGAVLIVQQICFSGPRVCLFRKGNEGIVFIQNQKETFVVGDNLPQDKLYHALYGLGTKRARALLGLSAGKSAQDKIALAEEMIYPFEKDNWPGKAYSFKDTRVEMGWGLFASKTGKMFVKEGYGGGGRKNVSYCFTFKDKKVCVGASGKFILNNNSIFWGKQNQTLCRRI